MAAARVVLERILRMLGDKELLASMRELEDLKTAVKKVDKPMAALEMDEGGSMQGRMGNLVALLYQADDLLDEILACYSCTRQFRVTEAPDADLGTNRHDPNVAEVHDANLGGNHRDPNIAEVHDANVAGNHPDQNRVVPRIMNVSSRVTQRVVNARGKITQTMQNAKDKVTQIVMNAGNTATQKVDLFLSNSIQSVFLLPVAARQVKKLSQEIDELGTKLENEFDNVVPTKKAFEPPRSYIPIRNSVIGREDDKRKIIENLLRPQEEHETGISVTSIIGSGGLGKSTLAEFVYDDEEVKSHFDLRMWIQASKISDEKDIIREIVESCTNRRSKYRQNPKPANFLHSHVYQNEGTFSDLLGCQSSDASTIITSNSEGNNEIKAYERRLQREIEGKLYLLVLDDACIIHGQRLKKLLATGARGSRILVTTRIAEGQILVNTDNEETYNLEGLSENDSWTLFKTYTWKEYRPRDPELKKIGQTIAENCGGVPLIIKVAASFLYSKTKETWSSFNDQLKSHDVPERMNHVLQVSYSDLPTDLKACFGYCSLFPDDFIFYKHDLISLWIAQGFISPPQSDDSHRSLEEKAERCFLELASRCFFEDVIIDDLRNIFTCKMHQVMRDLAEQYSDGIISSNKTDSGVELDSKCKHVCFTSDSDSLRTISKTMLQAKHLRTLISVKAPYSGTTVSLLVFNRLISGLKCLRVLALHDLGIDKLPISIGKMIHLRYLDLDRNDGLDTLPKSITKLYNLQTLKLNFCTKLRRLSGNFGKLVNLKRLEIDECDSLTSMPLGLEKLNQLETLSRFVVGQDISKDTATVGVKALRNLNNLKGRLAIEFTRDFTTTITEDPQADLTKKSNLVELKISWAKTVLNCKKRSNILPEVERASYKQLLENLKPNEELKSLCIEGYRGGVLPDWAGEDILTCLPHLGVIIIEGCDKCEHLPPFGKLPNLKELTLRHMDNVKYVQKERFQKSSAGDSQESSPADGTFFPLLEKLTLHNFYNLEGWWNEETLIIEDVELPSFRHLHELRIWNCPKLRSMPLFTRVIDIDLRNVNQALLQESAKKISSDASNSSTRNNNQELLEEIRNKISKFKIKKFQIKGCSNLGSLKTVRQGLGNLDSLQQLVIEKCNALYSLSSELSYLKSLKRLEISHCKKLNLSDDRSDNLRKDNAASSPWASLTSLRQLILREIPNMESLPEGIKHVRTLRSLCISTCASLTALPQWIDNLTALQHLRLESCKAITRLPDGLKNVISLMKVEITECPELMKNCKEHTGEDWHKIKHARVLLHKSWRYGLVPEIESSQNRSNVQALTDVKYIIIPVTASAEVGI